MSAAPPPPANLMKEIDEIKYREMLEQGPLKEGQYFLKIVVADKSGKTFDYLNGEDDPICYEDDPKTKSTSLFKMAGGDTKFLLGDDFIPALDGIQCLAIFSEFLNVKFGSRMVIGCHDVGSGDRPIIKFIDEGSMTGHDRPLNISSLRFNLKVGGGDKVVYLLRHHDAATGQFFPIGVEKAGQDKYSLCLFKNVSELGVPGSDAVNYKFDSSGLVLFEAVKVLDN